MKKNSINQNHNSDDNENNIAITVTSSNAFQIHTKEQKYNTNQADTS